MQAAINWAPYLIRHEQIAAGITGEDPDTMVAERVIRWLGRNKLRQFTRRDAFTACRGTGLRHSCELVPVLLLLESHAYIRPASQQCAATGGPVTHLYDVNPAVLK